MRAGRNPQSLPMAMGVSSNVAKHITSCLFTLSSPTPIAVGKSCVDICAYCAEQNVEGKRGTQVEQSGAQLIFLFLLSFSDQEKRVDETPWGGEGER